MANTTRPLLEQSRRKDINLKRLFPNIHRTVRTSKLLSLSIKTHFFYNDNVKFNIDNTNLKIKIQNLQNENNTL